MFCRYLYTVLVKIPTRFWVPDFEIKLHVLIQRSVLIQGWQTESRSGRFFFKALDYSLSVGSTMIPSAIVNKICIWRLFFNANFGWVNVHLTSAEKKLFDWRMISLILESWRWLVYSTIEESALGFLSAPQNFIKTLSFKTGKPSFF